MRRGRFPPESGYSFTAIRRWEIRAGCERVEGIVVMTALLIFADKMW